MPARPSSDMSSSSGASFHTAHENRQSMYPGMQARVSDAGDSELARRSRSELSATVESTRHDQDSNSSRRQSRRHPSPLGAVSEAGECDSDDGSSRSSVSECSLRPRDSASNRASSPSDSGYNSRNRSPRRNTRTHHRYEVEEEEEDHEYYDPRVGVIITNGPVVCIDRRALGTHANRFFQQRLGTRRDNRAVFRDQDHSSTSSGSYSARPRSPRSHDGSDESSRPSDDSRYDDYDDEYEEQFTPRARALLAAA